MRIHMPIRTAICVMIILCIAGCATTVSPLKTHFENSFRDFRPAEKELVRASAFKMDFASSFDEVWNASLYMLSQYAVIVDASKESGCITYVDIDGIFFEEVFTKHKFYYIEFPFTVLIETRSTGTSLSIYPMKDMYSKYSGRWWWKNVESAFDQKSNAFMGKLSAQLNAKERWQRLK